MRAGDKAGVGVEPVEDLRLNFSIGFEVRVGFGAGTIVSEL